MPLWMRNIRVTSATAAGAPASTGQDEIRACPGTSGVAVQHQMGPHYCGTGRNLPVVQFDESEVIHPVDQAAAGNPLVRLGAQFATPLYCHASVSVVVVGVLQPDRCDHFAGDQLVALDPALPNAALVCFGVVQPRFGRFRQ